MAQYHKQINANPHFTLRLVSPLLKAATQKQRIIELNDIMELGDIVYTIGFNPQNMKLTLRWNEYGETYQQSIRVVAEPSNIRSLSGIYVYYFICPQTGTKCRILYKMDYGGFCGRKALQKALYPIQMLSKKFRYIHYPTEEKQPYRKYGKEYYRGKLTPYGRKCKIFERALYRQEQTLYVSLNKFLINRIG